MWLEISFMLRDNSGNELTYEVFVAEASMIFNTRLIVIITPYPENAIILSPNSLLTQKKGHDVPSLQILDIRYMNKATLKYVQVLIVKDKFFTQKLVNYFSTLSFKCVFQRLV